MKISKNFRLEELTKSNAAESLKIDNTPRTEHIVNLCALVHHVLQPLRDSTGLAVRINSGFRSPATNKAIGGVPNSQHMRGQAADIVVAGMTPRYVADYIAHRFPFDQLIVYPTFVHVSYNIEGNRGERLTKRGHQ